MTFGPWVAGIDPAERLARLRALRAIGLTFARQHREFLETLARAELEPAVLPRALEQLEQLPAVPKRKLLATYADLGRALP